MSLAYRILILAALATSAFAQSAVDSGSTPVAPVAEGKALEEVTHKLDDLDQQIKVLQRLRENDLDSASSVTKSAAKIQAGASGLWIRSPDSTFGFRPRAIVRIGANWDLDDEQNKTLDNAQVQTARLGFDFALYKFVEGKVNLDVSKGNAAALQDGYLSLKLAPWVAVGAGKFQVPLGWERFISPSDLLFYDRALPSQIAPNRDVGLQFAGKLGNGVVEYAVGAFDGGSDGSNIDKDFNDDKDLYGRLWLAPARNTGIELLEGLGFGVGVSGGQHDGAVPSSYKTTSGNTFFSWNAADSLDGHGFRIAPQLAWTAGSYAVWGEWIASREVVYRGAATTITTDSVSGKIVYGTAKSTTAKPSKSLWTTAWQVGASWVLTGEDASFGGVKPAHPWGKDGWGALELSGRISQLVVSDAAFHGAAYADSTKSARQALSYGGAINWHLVKGTRLQAGYERTQFKDGAATGKVVRDRKPENQLFLIASTSI